jgi:predicted nucleic acid-binding Zn ribbon protein
VTTTPSASGADLARQALAVARAAAKNQPAAGPKKTRRSTRPARGEGRDPQGLGSVLARLTTDQGWDDSISGGNLIDQWATLCPHLVGRAEPVAYDEHRGRLDLRPGSHAYAAQLRLVSGQLGKQINDKLGRTVVRSIRVLPVGTLSTPNPGDATYAYTQPEGPVKTRETAHPGYRACLEAALAHKPQKQPTNPYVLEAMARQEQALRALRQPDSEHREAEWAQADAESGPAPGSVEASLAAARAYKRREQAGLTQPRRAFDVA